MRSFAIYAALLTLSCTSGQTPPPAPPPAPEPAPPPLQLKIEPLGIDLLERAVVLGTGDDGESTLVVLAETPERISVYAAYLRAMDGEPAAGGVAPVAIEAALSGRNGAVTIEPAGVAAWLDTAWTAAIEVTALLGRDVTALTMTLQPEGYVDGPSASGLVAATTLASLLGADLAGDATVIGVVNPDGTIGPVGDIGERAAAAATAGKTRVGYPAGQAVTIEGTPIADVREALAFLTGHALPAPRALEVDDMALADDAAVELETRYASWRTMLGLHWDTVLTVKTARQLPAPLIDLAERAQWAGTAAEKLAREGRQAAAYERIVEATVYAHTATSVLAILDKVRDGDVAGAVFLLDSELAAVKEAVAVVEQIGARTPETIGDTLQSLSAYQSALAGLALHRWSANNADAARALLKEVGALPAKDRKSSATTERIAAMLTAPLFAVARGNAYTRAATDVLAVETSDSLEYRYSEPAVRRLARAYAEAAGAALAYFGPLAPARQTDDQLRVVDPGHAVAENTLALVADSDKSSAGALQALAGAQLARLESALVLATWFSLGVERDLATGRIDGVRHAQALATLLHNSERKARASAHSARVAIGHIPIQARRHYLAALSLREGGVADRIAALEHFWRATVWSRTAVTLARHRER
jgi:hypothetical protein